MLCLLNYLFVQKKWRWLWLPRAESVKLVFALIFIGFGTWNYPDAPPKPANGTMTLSRTGGTCPILPNVFSADLQVDPCKFWDSAASLVLGLPNGFKKLLCWLALVSGGWWLLWWCLRYRLWKDYWHLGEVGNGATSNGEKKRFLLGSQEAFVARMAERLQSFGLDQPGPLYAIHGGWGSGKSFLMAELQARLQANPDIASVYAHVWREQTACDLHLALVDTILADHKILKRCFSAYSNRFVIHKLGDDLRRYLPRGLQFKNSVMEATIDPTQALPMLAQREFEKVVTCAVRSGLRIVICLDEIDRSTPAVAQAAIVMTRRALGLKGLAILLPYVDVQLSHKVFNPLNDYSPDLHQTFLVSVDAQHGQEINDRLLASESVPWPGPSGPVTAAKDAPADTAGNAKAKAEPADTTLFAQQRRSREGALLETYARLGEDKRIRIQRQNEEKYLSLKEHVPKLTPSDLPGMLRFETVHSALKAEIATALNCQDRGPNFIKELCLVTKNFRFEEDPASRRPPPAIRSLEGHLVSMFGAAPGYDGPKDAMVNDEQVVAAILCLAWRTSQYLVPTKEPEEQA